MSPFQLFPQSPKRAIDTEHPVQSCIRYICIWVSLLEKLSWCGTLGSSFITYAGVGYDFWLHFLLWFGRFGPQGDAFQNWWVLWVWDPVGNLGKLVLTTFPRVVCFLYWRIKPEPFKCHTTLYHYATNLAFFILKFEIESHWVARDSHSWSSCSSYLNGWDSRHVSRQSVPPWIAPRRMLLEGQARARHFYCGNKKVDCCTSDNKIFPGGCVYGKGSQDTLTKMADPKQVLRNHQWHRWGGNSLPLPRIPTAEKHPFSHPQRTNTCYSIEVQSSSHLIHICRPSSICCFSSADAERIRQSSAQPATSLEGNVEEEQWRRNSWSGSRDQSLSMQLEALKACQLSLVFHWPLLKSRQGDILDTEVES